MIHTFGICSTSTAAMILSIFLLVFFFYICEQENKINANNTGFYKDSPLFSVRKIKEQTNRT